ncbi:hypothetical protein [Labrys monachus]|uniref:Uncharacterized protein n=1 Tax=Labrys monachus TaxID=217067 RepID=A0ABU0FEM4_9HYPH|nr:hypothetical protein [Labrys monachus]MDQ0393064.1 hypothetical protein [Labrys monachus]
MKGDVLVNHGNGFILMAAAGPLAIGDTVMARPGARAVLRYADGCKVDIIPGTVLTVENVSPCAFLDTTGSTSDATGQTTNSNTTPGDSTFPVDALVAAGLGGAIAGGVIGTTLSSEDNSASP